MQTRNVSELSRPFGRTVVAGVCNLGQAWTFANWRWPCLRARGPELCVGMALIQANPPYYYVKPLAIVPWSTLTPGPMVDLIATRLM